MKRAGQQCASTETAKSGFNAAWIVSNYRAIVCVIDDLTLGTYSKRDRSEKTKKA
jgi:hypothetical protein